MKQQSYITVEAGLALWVGVRSIAAGHGLTIEESKGWFRRSFVLRGDPASLLAAARDLSTFFAQD